MTIDRSQLATFAAVLRHGSFDAAGRAMHITPSAVSQRIRQLEERMGQVLVQRATPCIATQAGQVLQKLAEQVALLETEAVRTLGGTAGTGRVRMPIVVNMDSLESWFLSMYTHLADSAALRIDISVEDQDCSASLLREGAVVAAVTADSRAVQGCDVVPLGVMRYLAIASPAFASQYFADGPVDAAFAAAPMVIYNRKDGLQDRFISQFSGTPAAPDRHCIPSAVGFIEAARRGMGWCMVPEQMAKPAMARGEVIEIVPGSALDVPLFWQRWSLSSPALNQLTEAVLRAARENLRA